MNNITIAIIGALIPHLMDIIREKYKEPMPIYFKQPMYWLALAAQVLLGAFTYYLLKDQIGGNKISIAACGFASSAILSAVLGAAGNALGSGNTSEKSLTSTNTTKSFWWFLK